MLPIWDKCCTSSSVTVSVLLSPKLYTLLTHMNTTNSAMTKLLRICPTYIWYVLWDTKMIWDPYPIHALTLGSWEDTLYSIYTVYTVYEMLYGLINEVLRTVWLRLIPYMVWKLAHTLTTSCLDIKQYSRVIKWINS